MSAPSTQPRSTDAEDYQRLAQPVGAMMKSFADGDVIEEHAHPRDQLLYSISGVMGLRAERDSLVVPPDRAVRIPAGLRHSVRMHGAVEMRTLYIAPRGTASMLRVHTVSPLLKALIVALCEGPMTYEKGSRGDHIACLIEDELGRTTDLPLNAPLPRDRRLQNLCAAILADPSDRRTLEGWSETAGASARTLARLFKSDLGMSFAEWRQRVRLHHAMVALENGRSVAEVARSCGYRSPSAFTAAYRKAMGAPPTERMTAPRF